jgi:hypothetical protein
MGRLLGEISFAKSSRFQIRASVYFPASFNIVDAHRPEPFGVVAMRVSQGVRSFAACSK